MSDPVTQTERAPEAPVAAPETVPVNAPATSEPGPAPATEPVAALDTAPESAAPVAPEPRDLFDADMKAWFRANAHWVLIETQLIQSGRSEEERARLNP